MKDAYKDFGFNLKNSKIKKLNTFIDKNTQDMDIFKYFFFNFLLTLISR